MSMLSGISECKVAGGRRQSSYKLHSSARAVKKNHTGSYSKKKNSFSSAYVLKWLTDNYIKDPQACIARCVMYAHYEDFCKKQCVSPYSSASFGKIVRMKFPHIKTRRLGTRGQSKYHYYGISVKESSSYYFKGAQIKNGLTRFSCCYLKQTEFAAHPDSSTSLLSFSSLDSINFSKSEKLDTFLLMYKSHCQRFYDSITKENFDEIEDFLLHFWKGMPSHIMSILNYQVTADLIRTCDLVLYKAICDIVISDSLTSHVSSVDLISFATNLERWLLNCLDNFPELIKKTKMQVVRCFVCNLKQQLNLMELTKKMRCLTSASHTALNDLQLIDKTELKKSVQKVRLKRCKLDSNKIILEFIENLQQTFINHSKIEEYFLWMDSMFEDHVINMSNESDTIDNLHDFLLLWNFLVTNIEITLITNEAKSQDLFNVLCNLLTEYIIYMTELVQFHLTEKQQISILRNHAEQYHLSWSELDNSSLIIEIQNVDQQLDMVISSSLDSSMSQSSDDTQSRLSSLSLPSDSSSFITDSPFSSYSMFEDGFLLEQFEMTYENEDYPLNIIDEDNLIKHDELYPPSNSELLQLLDKFFNN